MRRVLGKHRVKLLSLSQVNLLKEKMGVKLSTSNLLNPLKHFGVAVRQVVNNNDLSKPCVLLKQFNDSVRADVSNTTGNQQSSRLHLL